MDSGNQRANAESMRLIATFLLCTAAIMAQPNPGYIGGSITQPDCSLTVTFTAAAPSVSFDNRLKGCLAWQLTYSNTGFSGVNIQPEEAPDNAGVPGSWVVWPAAQVLSGSFPLTATTQSQASFQSFFPWVRINPTSATGTGTIQATLYGWRQQGGAINHQVSGVGATGSPAIGAPVYVGGNSSGNLFPIVSCDLSKVQALTTTAAVVVLPAVSGKTNYICGFELSSVASAATAVQIIAGTQTTNPCDTGAVPLSALLQLVLTTPTTIIEGSGLGTIMRGTTTNQQICATESVGATSVSLKVNYTVF